MKSIKTPILLISYKRLNTVVKVLESIANYKPEKLYLFSDGPKSLSEDNNKILKVREYLKSNITWDCEVLEFFNDKNLGCKYGPQEAISWFFKHEEMGIILEDDTVPDKSFYGYCEELLTTYKNDQRIWNIGGSKMDKNTIDDKESYRFSRFPHTWGWATWADRWSKHIETLPELMKDANHATLDNIFPNAAIVKNWKQKAKISYVDELDAWDYLWSFRVLLNGGLSTAPSKNLISNIGFGEEATHTFSKDADIKITEQIKLPLIHPSVILPNTKKDVAFFEHYFNWKPLSKKIRFRHIMAVIKSRFLSR